MNGSDHTNWWEIMIVNTLHRALPVMGFHLLWKDFPMAMNGAEQEVIKTNPRVVELVGGVRCPLALPW